MVHTGYLTNIASEFYVVSILSRQGMDANLTLGNKKRVDILVALAEGRALTIDVKAVSKKMDWLLGNSLPHSAPGHFVVLVSYEGKFADPTFLPRIWVVPSESLLAYVKTAGNGTTRYVPRKAFLERAAEFENAWSLLV